MIKTNPNKTEGIVFSIEGYAVHDGPGIRTLVFFKGCPLRCQWCDNPESQCKENQIFLITDRCIGCGQCVDMCSQNATTLSNGQLRVNRKLCTACGKCVETCYSGTRVLVGKRMTARAVLDQITKDLRFYRRSSGGVTLSGGEPLMQAKFARAILIGCRDRSIHTTVETSGYANWREAEAVLSNVDLVILDIKHMDSLTHRKFTGVPNELILENAKKISILNVPMIIRIPIIPGYNDSEANIEATAAYVTKLSSVDKVELLTYHSLGAPKYLRLGLKYKLRNLRPPSNGHVEKFREIIASHGIECRVH